jgi:GT2 family glycosyltransferase
MGIQNQKITVVIPTYNRPEDLRITLNSIIPLLAQINEVIIADQSKDDRTKKLIRSLKNKKIKYYYSKIPSITIARNLGIKHASKASKFIGFIDDDVNLDKNYFNEILKVFENNPSAKGVSAFDNSPFRESALSKLTEKLFFLRRRTKEKAIIISAYGNLYPLNLDKIISAQWLPGVNMCYRKEVFEEQMFDEHLLGYTIAEDTDFSYRLYKKYPNSLFITPFAKIRHRGSQVERTPTEKMAYVNQVDHFYFFFKDMNISLLNRIKFAWSLMGISLLRTAKLVFKPNKDNYLKWKYFFSSLFYCLGNASIIKKGKLREFTAHIK